MRGKYREFAWVGAALVATAMLGLFCVEATAQTSLPAARPALQQRALQAIIAFTTLGMIYVVLFAIGVGVLAIQLWARVMFPNRTAAVLRALEGTAWKRFVVGLVNFAFLFALFLCFSKIRWLGWLAGLVGILMLALIFLGLLGMAERLGERIESRAGWMPNPITSILIGWPVLYLVALVPLLGWALSVYLFLSGMGAAVLSFIGEPRTAPREPAGTP